MRNLIVLITLIYSQFLYSQTCSNVTATDIFGNTSTQLSCGAGACIGLTVNNIPTTFLTTSYQVEPQNYAPAIPFNEGTPLNADSDDAFSDIIPLPFNFCFYGETYDKLVISTNGFITFDTKQAGLASNPNILEANPSTLLPKNSIFGVMQDLIFSKTGEGDIYYTVTGTAPCRKFIVSFYKARITGCTETSTSQIVLSEFSNEIEVIVENKPLPCTTAKFKESLIGIMNAEGTNGLSPSGRNAVVWQSGNESWKFRPEGAEVQPNIVWKNSSGQIVGNTATIDACPTKNEKYTVTLDYLVCTKSFTISDDIDVTYSQTGGSAPVINSPVSFTYTLCDNNADNTELFNWNTMVTPLITTDPTVNVRYYNTLSAAEQGGAGISNIKGGRYTVYARVTNQSGCYTIGIINMNITFLEKIEATDIKKLYCFDGKEDFAVDLNTLYPEMLITPMSKITKVSFYVTQADATIPNESASVPPNQILTKDGNLVVYTYFVRFENADGCFTVKKITIELRNPFTASNQNICDFKNDGVENVILSSLNSAVAAGQPVKVSYFPDSASANANTGAITTYQLDNSSGPAVIYVRLDMVADNGNCFRVYPVSLKLVASPILTKDFLAVDLGLMCDNNNDGSEPVDLTQFQKEIYSGAEQFNYTYYQSYNSNTGVLGNRIADPKAFRISKDTDVYVRVAKGACFAVAKIELDFNFLPAVILQSGIISKCDKGYDYGETYDLNDAIEKMYLPAQNADVITDIEVTYHATQEDANEGILKINNLQTTYYNTVTYWARFQSKNSQCFSVAPIVLKTYFPPKAIPSTIKVCDSNIDGTPEVNLLLPEFTENMVSETDPENNFRFYLTLADVAADRPIQNPERFSHKPFPSRIYVLVENIAGCFTLPSTIDFILGTALSVDNDTFTLEQCDDANDGKEMIDITQFQDQIYKPTAIYSYYPTLKDLNADTNKITTPSAYQYDNRLHTPVIFVKVEEAGSGSCPALVKINIHLKKAPVFELEDYYFCPGVGIRIEPDLSFLDPREYIWKNPAGEIISKEKYIDGIKTEGIYSLTIQSGNTCSHTDYFEVKPYELPVITQLVGLSFTSYQVIATGSRKIVYSIDGMNWQDSNVFENLPPGRVTFYVRYEDSECLGDSKDGLSVKIINVITPNDDNINDRWSFSNLDVFKNVPSNLKIYDRNGVLVYEQQSTESFIWDGKFNGRSLPTASYWYIMALPDRTVTGWILLKNRN
ncbi:MAG: T9SS type B sorting domain-containing protein [Chryseobacterium sp.]|nr:T9SS type B sorting domain-containing protein [Chryseobacterium sp.]